MKFPLGILLDAAQTVSFSRAYKTRLLTNRVNNDRVKTTEIKTYRYVEATKQLRRSSFIASARTVPILFLIFLYYPAAAAKVSRAANRAKLPETFGIQKPTSVHSLWSTGCTANVEVVYKMAIPFPGPVILYRAISVEAESESRKSKQ